MINVAVVGIGNMGRHHARVYSELKEANLVALADLNENGAAVAKKFGCRFYRDYREMLKKEKIDAISVAVPTKLHEEIALHCIDAGKHVLIEKPIAENIESAQRIIEAGRKKSVVVAVGHIERFNPAVQKLKEIIAQGKLGEITSIIARRVGIFPPQIKDANVVVDLAVHDIDVFNFLLERSPKSIYAMAGKALDKRREDHAIILVDYALPCFIQVNWITPVKIRNLAVTGTKGYAELNYITQELKLYESIYEKTYDTFGDFVWKFGMPREIEVSIQKEEPLKLELDNFIKSVKKESSLIAPASEGLHALQIALAAVESYKHNKIVRILK